MTENPELMGGLLERGELLEKLFLSEFRVGKLPLLLS
jgi:hypothetical protein